jgi:hypothetical protein
MIINLKTFIITSAAILSTWACRKLGLTADFPLTLVGVAIVFPIVFSIGGAYKRREAALREYGSLKAHGRALYFASRDWLAEEDKEIQSGLRGLLEEFLNDCHELLHTPVRETDEKEKKVYSTLSRLSQDDQFLREHKAHLPVPYAPDPEDIQQALHLRAARAVRAVFRPDIG